MPEQQYPSTAQPHEQVLCFGCARPILDGYDIHDKRGIIKVRCWACARINFVPVEHLVLTQKVPKEGYTHNGT